MRFHEVESSLPFPPLVLVTQQQLVQRLEYGTYHMPQMNKWMNEWMNERTNEWCINTFPNENKLIISFFKSNENNPQNL